jgi:hypothetical protein
MRDFLGSRGGGTLYNIGDRFFFMREEVRDKITKYLVLFGINDNILYIEYLPRARRRPSV